MNEFNNRIDAQHSILRIINNRSLQSEELSGLSTKAIDRWMLANQIDANSRLAELVRAAGRSLFFLANKSQEQITEEYKNHSLEVSRLASDIATEIRSSS